MAGDEAAIRTLDLSKQYGESTALSGLTLSVPRGQVYGFLGPNGSGKTTTVKLLLGLAAPSGGEAWLLGRPAGHRETRRRVGYLPELFRYQAWLTAREVLALHCRLAQLPRPSWPGEIDAALSTVDSPSGRPPGSRPSPRGCSSASVSPSRCSATPIS